MTTRIIINGKEVTSPFTRALLMLSAIIISALATAIVIFVLLPIIGVAVTLSIGFILIFIAATIVSMAVLVFVVLISAWLSGSTELRIEKIRKRM